MQKYGALPNRRKMQANQKQKRGGLVAFFMGPFRPMHMPRYRIQMQIPGLDKYTSAYAPCRHICISTEGLEQLLSLHVKI